MFKLGEFFLRLLTHVSV